MATGRPQPGTSQPPRRFLGLQGDRRRQSTAGRAARRDEAGRKHCGREQVPVIEDSDFLRVYLELQHGEKASIEMIPEGHFDDLREQLTDEIDSELDAQVGPS